MFDAQARVCLPVCSTPAKRYYNTVLCWDYFSSSSVVSRAFSALCMYSKSRHHLHPLGYLRAKFHFFCGLRCWASPWRETAYSITHPAYLMPREPKRFRKSESHWRGQGRSKEHQLYQRPRVIWSSSVKMHWSSYW